MEVLRKDEDDWWYARHSDGREGSIPVPYVVVVSTGSLSFLFVLFVVAVVTLRLFHLIAVPLIYLFLSAGLGVIIFPGRSAIVLHPHNLRVL